MARVHGAGVDSCRYVDGGGVGLFGVGGEEAGGGGGGEACGVGG